CVRNISTAPPSEAQVNGTWSVQRPAVLFCITPHAAVMHEALLPHLANRRLGTRATKTRGEVAGITRKIWRQKGTGRARHGSRKAPLFIGGGITFGPKPRDYRQGTPQKVRHLAVRSALSAKAAAGQIVVVAPPVLEAPRTKVIVALLRRLPVAGRTLLVTAAPDAILARSASNLPHVTVRPATSLRIHEILTADCVVLT